MSLASTIIVKTGKKRRASNKNGNILFLQELRQNPLTFPGLFSSLTFPGFPGFPGAYKPCTLVGICNTLL